MPRIPRTQEDGREHAPAHCSPTSRARRRAMSAGAPADIARAEQVFPIITGIRARLVPQDPTNPAESGYTAYRPSTGSEVTSRVWDLQPDERSCDRLTGGLDEEARWWHRNGPAADGGDNCSHEAAAHAGYLSLRATHGDYEVGRFVEDPQASNNFDAGLRITLEVGDTVDFELGGGVLINVVAENLSEVGTGGDYLIFADRASAGSGRSNERLLVGERFLAMVSFPRVGPGELRALVFPWTPEEAAEYWVYVAEDTSPQLTITVRPPEPLALFGP